MNSHEQYVYEVTYSVADQFSEAHETWLPKTTEQWITTAKLDGFESEQNVLGESPEVRLRLTFETFAQWTAFVESDAYRDCLEQLQPMTEHLTTHLWEPTTISLHSPANDGTQLTADGCWGDE
ncbi:hypothetical protein [Haloferax marinisediminis]|nr:hypothetical protein [Haloferax marinisediminis]